MPPLLLDLIYASQSMCGSKTILRIGFGAILTFSDHFSKQGKVLFSNFEGRKSFCLLHFRIFFTTSNIQSRFPIQLVMQLVVLTQEIEKSLRSAACQH